TADVFPLLGVSPLLGRVFDSEKDAGTVIISYGLWQSQFGGNSTVLGTKVNLDGVPYTVVGVMPPAFYFPGRDIQLWTLLTFSREDFANRSNSYLQGIARLKRGASFERARAELSTIADRLARDHPDTNAESGISFFRMRDNMSPRFRLMLLTLSGASLCLLLLTCANLANL